MILERRARLVLLAAAMVVACRDRGELDTGERRPYAPPESQPSRTVQVRNTCPEAVVLALSATEPDASTPTMTLGSTKVEALTVEPGARIWLRYDGRFSEDLSVAPTGAIEIAYQCNGIYARNGGL